MNQTQCTTDNPCAAMQLLTQALRDTKADVDELRREVKELTLAMRDRLPPWVAWAFAGAGAALGILGTLASK